jgi:hypothetical protein
MPFDSYSKASLYASPIIEERLLEDAASNAQQSVKSPIERLSDSAGQDAVIRDPGGPSGDI